MGEGGRIDYYTGGALARLVNPVDQLKLGIGLAEFDAESQLSGRVPALGLYVGQRLVSVDFGFALAEQVQVGAVQNIDDRVHVVGVRILLRGTIRLGRRARCPNQCYRGGPVMSNEFRRRILLEG